MDERRPGGSELASDLRRARKAGGSGAVYVPTAREVGTLERAGRVLDVRRDGTTTTSGIIVPPEVG